MTTERKTISLASQITWLESQIEYMEHSLVWAVKEERLTIAAATAKLNAAKAALDTLVQIRDITKPKEPTHA